MNFKPSAGEIANLWKFITGNQAHLCVLDHWIYQAEDSDVKEILLQAKDIATKIVENGSNLYQKSGFPLPIGFDTKKDVMPKTPRLMSDKLVLTVLHILSEYGVYGYGLTVGKTETPEVLSFFQECLKNSSKLYQSITELLHKKGLAHQPAYIPTPKQPVMVENQSFLSGWWGEQRPLTCIEIDSLIFSLRGVMLSKLMLEVFYQIAKDSKLKKLCQRGKDLSGKRLEKIQSLNSIEGLPFQATYESEITDSTVSPFSDRLIMFEVLSLEEISIARYGNALSAVVRRDLSTMFALYIVETGTLVDDILSLMIEKNWFEQPPMASNPK